MVDRECSSQPFEHLPRAGGVVVVHDHSMWNGRGISPYTGHYQPQGSGDFGTHKTVNAKFWPWLQPRSSRNVQPRKAFRGGISKVNLLVF